MTHTPDTEPINDKASEIVAFLHLMNRHDLSGALTRERLTMIRMVSDLVEHRRRLFEALEMLSNEVGGLGAFEIEIRVATGNTNWAVLTQRRQEAVSLLEELHRHVAPGGAA